MKRFIYRAILKDMEDEKVDSCITTLEASAKALICKGVLMTLSLFKLNRNLFLYYECINENITPAGITPELDSMLEMRPDGNGGKIWIPMSDIFHFSEPVSVEHWKRKEPVQKRVGMIARIRPDMLSSYIYYHYMLQEGQLTIVNKYCMIGLDENLIFYYEEQPVTSELPQRRGKLNTNGLPSDWQNIWQDLMEPHFILWEEVPEQDKKLRPCKIVFEC